MLFHFFSFLLQCVLWVLVHIKEFGSKKKVGGHINRSSSLSQKTLFLERLVSSFVFNSVTSLCITMSNFCRVYAYRLAWHVRMS